jgi:hypothetical protein
LNSMDFIEFNGSDSLTESPQPIISP